MKQYGLILKGKNAEKAKSKPKISFFDEEEEEIDPKKKELEARMATQAKLAKQAEMEHAEILKDNPDAFEYDEVYDTLKEDTAEQSLMRHQPADKSRKSKYIEDLKAAARLKEREQFQYLDRKIQRERKHEKDEYGDTDKFVTSSYKNHLQDLKRWKEEDEKQIAAEAMEDPTKKGHMMDFYSGLLRGNVALGTNANTHNEKPKVEKVESTDKPVIVSDKAEVKVDSPKPVINTATEKSVVKSKIRAPVVVQKRDIDAAKERYLARKKARLAK